MGILKLLLKVVGMGILGLVILAYLGQVIFEKSYKFPDKINYGVSFSPQYAQFLGLDPTEILELSLNELNIKEFRLPTYWSYIEKTEDEFDFSEVDLLVDEIFKKEGKILLVVGYRQPRWPECYLPAWAKGLSLEQKRQKILQFLQKTVQKYQGHPAIRGFQVENEPFLPFFGENCEAPDTAFFKKEVELVRKLSNKPIVISDSGELGNWILAMQLSDIFSTTLYRDVYNPILGYIRYPILPYLYNLKSQFTREVFAKNNQKTIIGELQAEPWIGTEDLLHNPKKQAEIFPIEKFTEYVEYAQKTGFDTQYLWGLEWWLWMDKNGYPEYLEYARILF